MALVEGIRHLELLLCISMVVVPRTETGDPGGRRPWTGARSPSIVVVADQRQV
jgi:hypothetical protein